MAPQIERAPATSTFESLLDEDEEIQDFEEGEFYEDDAPAPAAAVSSARIRCVDVLQRQAFAWHAFVAGCTPRLTACGSPLQAVHMCFHHCLQNSTELAYIS